jgi:hypothetical protein
LAQCAHEITCVVGGAASQLVCICFWLYYNVDAAIMGCRCRCMQHSCPAYLCPLCPKSRSHDRGSAAVVELQYLATPSLPRITTAALPPPLRLACFLLPPCCCLVSCRDSGAGP